MIHSSVNRFILLNIQSKSEDYAIYGYSNIKLDCIMEEVTFICQIVNQLFFVNGVLLHPRTYLVLGQSSFVLKTEIVQPGTVLATYQILVGALQMESQLLLVPLHKRGRMLCCSSHFVMCARAAILHARQDGSLFTKGGITSGLGRPQRLLGQWIV